MHGSEKALVLKEKFMAEVGLAAGSCRVYTTHRLSRLTNQIARHPAFKLSDIHDLSKDELRERTMEKVCLSSSHYTSVTDGQFASMVYFVTTESLETFTLRMQVCRPSPTWVLAASW